MASNSCRSLCTRGLSGLGESSDLQKMALCVFLRLDFKKHNGLSHLLRCQVHGWRLKADIANLTACNESLLLGWK